MAPETGLIEARQQYVEQLRTFRLQLYHWQPDDYEHLEARAETYAHSFRNHLLGSVGLAGSMADETINEIETRRSVIEEELAVPLQLSPRTEIFIGASAAMTMTINGLEGKIPSAIGSAILVASSAMSYQYRRKANVTLAIKDNALVEYGLAGLRTNQSNDIDLCTAVLKATMDSEKLAVLQVASKGLRAKVYTPFGYLRLAIYNLRQRRRHD